MVQETSITITGQWGGTLLSLQIHNNAINNKSKNAGQLVLSDPLLLG